MRSKLTQETMAGICDSIMGGCMSFAKAARINNLSVRSFWQYIRLSQAGDADATVEWLGERLPFHRAVNQARRLALAEARGALESKAINGWDEVALYQGQVVWQLDPVTVGWTEQEREALGFRPDGLLEVNGRPVPVTIHHEPSDALLLRVAEMFAPGEYRPGTNANIEINGRVNMVGVGIAKPLSAPPVVPPAPVPPLPRLTMVDDELEPEVTDEAPETDISDTDPTEFADSFEPLPPSEPTPEPERVYSEPVPAQYQPTGNPLITPRGGRPLSPLERDLLSRSRTVPDAVDRSKA